MMQQTVTLETLIWVAGGFMACWTFVKVVREVLDTIKSSAIAKYAKEQKVDDVVNDIEEKRVIIVDTFNKRLDALDKKIDENYCETLARTQELKSEILLVTRSLRAILEGQIEQGCNGPVKQAKKDLDEFLMSKL